MPARLAIVNIIAERRGTRNGSRRHNSTNSGAATSAPTMRPMRRTGKIISRKLIVSASTTRKSKKLTLISWMLILNCDSTINASIMISDSAAASAGRRNSASQTPLRKHQVSSASPSANALRSIQPIVTSAAMCGATTAASAFGQLTRGGIVSAAQRCLLSDRRAARMTGAGPEMMSQIVPGTRRLS